MNQKEIKELIDFLIEKDIAEFELERGDVKLRVKRGGATAIPSSVAIPVSVAAPAPPPAAVPPTASHSGAPPAAAATAASAAPSEDESSWQIVRSPIVGTFYESPSPGAPAFVKT